MAGRKRVDKQIRVGNVSRVSGKVTIAGGDVYEGYTAEQVSILLEQITTKYQRKTFDGRCPYKGLAVFEEEDADLFFGRERLVEDLVSRVKESRTVFITGPSGSGKSSLVRAGLIHALKDGAIRSSKSWSYETIKPGREPLKDLSLAFSRLKSPELADYFTAHVTETDILHRCAESVLSGRKDQRFVLFVDQFEEVFTQVNNESERRSFLDMLAHAGTIEDGRVIVLFAMRSDFISNCAAYPAINELLSQQFRQIGAMQPQELVSAIALPAKEVGLPIEEELVAQIINDMKGEPGALPLMQFALQELFAARQAIHKDIALTLADYLERGGIQKILARHADETFNQLSSDQQELARSIFSGLIEIGKGRQDTRRTALFDELIPANTNALEVETVVQKLADARLVITDEQAGNDTVTISHERLITAWPWLEKLINENRDVIALQNEIASDAKEWDDHNRDASYLYSGARLVNADEQLRSNRLVLSGTSLEYIQVGQTRQRRSQIVLFGTLAIIFTLLITAVAIFANLTKQAREQAAVSRSQVLAANAQLQSSKSQLSMLLALESFHVAAHLSDSEKVFSEQVVRDSLNQLGGIPLVGHEGAVHTVLFSRDGLWLVTESPDGTARLWATKDPTAAPIVLRGNKDKILNAAFDPKGHWLATGSSDGTIRLLAMKDQPAGTVVLRRYNDRISALAFSPDGRWLAAASSDSSTRLWDVMDLSADPIVLGGHTGFVHTLAFSPDGRWLASGGSDSTIFLWKMKDIQAEPVVLHGERGLIEMLAFSPDGRWLAAVDDNGVTLESTAFLWDMNNPASPTVLPGGQSSIETLAFSPDGHSLAAVEYDYTIHIFDISDLTTDRVVLRGFEDFIAVIAFSPDGRWLVAGGYDATTRLWDMTYPDADPIILHAHEGAINALAFSSDGHWLATGSDDHTARLWEMDILSSEPIVLRNPEEGVFTLAFSPNGHWLASGGWDATALLWDTTNLLAQPVVLRGHKDYVNTVAFSPDSRWLATGSYDGDARLWSTHDPTAQPFVLRGHAGIIFALAFSPDGRWLATGSDDKTARLWDVNNPTAAPVILRGHEAGIVALAFSPDGKWLATGSADNTVRLWDMHNPSAEPIIQDSSTSLAFSPDGRWLARGSVDMTVGLWSLKDIQSKPILLLGPQIGIMTLVFSPNSRWLAVAGSDLLIRVWDMTKTNAEPMILRGHEATIDELAFSPDGRWLASGSSDATARLWDTKNPTAEAIVLRGHKVAIRGLAFSPDGHWLAAGGSDGTVRRSDNTIRLWSLNFDEVVAEACKLVGRNFTRAEWAQYIPNQEYRKTCDQWPLQPATTP